MALRFDAILCSNLRTKFLMRAISNVHSDRILGHGPQAPQPCCSVLATRKRLDVAGHIRWWSLSLTHVLQSL